MSAPVVLITGASAGVGRATATAFARHGYSVALLARGGERLADARAELEQLGCRALDISVDVADADAVEAAADRVENELGPIDVWVNNAMATVFAPFADTGPTSSGDCGSKHALRGSSSLSAQSCSSTGRRCGSRWSSYRR